MLERTKRVLGLKCFQIIRYFVKKIVIIASILICSGVAKFINFFPDVFIALASSSITIIVTIEILKLFIKLDNYTEHRRLSKPFKGSRNLTLYRWAEGIEVEERIFYAALMNISKEDPMQNLITIKKTIKKICSGNLINLKLFKAYIDRCNNNNNFLDKFWSIFIGIVVSVITSLINKGVSTTINKEVSTTNLINTGKKLFNGSINTVDIPFILTLINYSTYFFIMLILFMYIWNVTTRDKRRFNLISQIIDVAILEIEDKNNRRNNS